MGIPLYWWHGRPNFGDLLSPLIVSYVSRRDVCYSEAPGKLLAIGSILGFAAKENDIVWGSGMLYQRKLPDVLHVHAVRGPLTRDVFLRQGLECPPVYGDPAWLTPRFYQPAVEKKYETAVLPHRSDFFLQRMTSGYAVELLSVKNSPLTVIDGILAAERLVTSSLHGLIIAETYGIPVVLLRHKKQTWEKHFKFVDYFLSTGREDQTIWNMSIEEAIKWIPKFRKPVPIDSEKLLDSFPGEYFKQGGEAYENHG